MNILKKYYFLVPAVTTLLIIVVSAAMFTHFNKGYDWSAHLYTTVKEGNITDFLFDKGIVFALFFGILTSVLLWFASQFESRKLTTPLGLLAFLLVSAWGSYSTIHAYVVEHDWNAPLGLVIMPVISLIATGLAMLVGWFLYTIFTIRPKV